MKEFCIAGPVSPEDHYYIPHRLNWQQLNQFIASKFYFVLHAPRQSGKTTAIQEYSKHLNEQGQYRALYINIESAEALKDNITGALSAILSEFKDSLQDQLPGEEATINFINTRLKNSNLITFTALVELLGFWTKASAQPTVLFIDEIDSLVGDSLLSVLRQIRRGFDKRPQGFPQALCLIGLRDVRDYRICSKEQGIQISTSSPFNIKARSITLKNFSLEQVQDLYGQHTAATGQVFTDEAIAYAYFLTQGQPWLTNALAYQACFEDVLDRTQPITKNAIEQAKEQLIIRRETHLDSLIEKLKEERVRGVIDAIISGKTEIASFDPDDLQYVQDLGLIKQTEIAIANPMYQEIIPRVLTHIAQKMIRYRISWYLNKDGTLHMNSLLEGFTQFFRENAQVWSDQFSYQESYPHLLLMAFLQRLINGGGTINREYALGKKRVDIGITWPVHLNTGEIKKQRFAIELKIKHGEDTLKKGLEQTAGYMDTYAATEGHLVIFDRDPTKTWEEKISNEILTFASKKIHVWTM
jgi:hypothetical protein